MRAHHAYSTAARLAAAAMLLGLAASEAPRTSGVVAPRAHGTIVEAYTPPVSEPKVRPAAIKRPPITAPGTLPAATGAGRTALLVGIDNAAGGAPLPGSVTDATNVRNALLNYGFRSEDVTMLLEGAATRPAILAELRRLAARTPASGIAVFVVATHSGRSSRGNSFRTAEGARIYAGELGALLAAVRAPMWVALPTCYAAGYAVPGVVGPNRVATFASPANEVAYQAGSAGSFLILNMVRRGMIEGGAPESVETAFEFARTRIAAQGESYVPVINDGFAGDLVLGPVSWLKPKPRKAEPRSAPHGSEPPPSDSPAPEPIPQPSPSPSPGGGSDDDSLVCVLGICRR